MGGIDATTWDAIGAVLTVVGLVISVLVWRRRGAAAGLRGVAWSLLPVAAGLTGVLRLIWEIGGSIGRWALRFVFSPVVWLGVIVAGVALVLFVVSGLLRRRGPSRKAAHGRRRSREAVTDKSSRKPAVRSDDSDDSDDDLEDVEAILRRHGIT